MLIRKFIKSDIKDIARIHLSGLDNDIFPSLGIKFLEKYYNKSQNSLFVAVDLRVYGFISVSLESENVFNFISIKDLLILAKKCLLNPQLIISIIIQLRRNKNTADTNSSEISFIVVDEEYRGKGIGNLLIGQAMAFSKANNKQYIKTKTANEKLALFYKQIYNAEIIDSFNVLNKRYEILKWKI
ncbi:MAG: GNAT family N-acetyltransferase [Rickettsia endosymbiont of Bryobia graminum]|nr:GNAT family N-acetyltransferase [Rickettsia endosymbiont of Bryobia graminum]